MEIKKRLIEVLELSKKTRQDLADKLGVGRAAVSDMLNKEGEIDSLKYISAAASITGASYLWILTGRGPMMIDSHEARVEAHRIALEIAEKSFGDVDTFDPSIVMEPPFSETSKSKDEGSPERNLAGKNIRVIAVPVDRSGKELITYVPVKAQAGYKRGYGDPQFIQKLPAFSLPILISQNTTHRMFQVDGNSMRQIGGGGLNDGDVVIASYVEDIFSIKDGRVFVVVTTEGIVIKRVINRLNSADKVLVLNSDNKSGDYATIIAHPHEILEVWELKAFLSKQLSLSTDLWDVINDLTAKQAIMEDKIKGLETGKKLKQ